MKKSKIQLLGKWDEQSRDAFGRKLKIGVDNTLYLSKKTENKLKKEGMKHNSIIIITFEVRKKGLGK